MKFAVIGDPISHSLSPVMHSTNFKVLGLNDTYEALHIPVQDFDNIKEIITEKNLSGFNVTIPHKERIIPFLDDIDEQAKAVGAVNTVKIEGNKWIGYNTDGLGYVKGLKQVYPDLSNAYILILGAGGASKGIATALSQCVQPKLTIANTTSAGLDNNKESVIRLNQLSPNTLVSDIIYIPYKTSFLQQAEEKGNPIYNGLDMFVYQGAESFKIWTGKDAEIKEMKLAVLNQLKGE